MRRIKSGLSANELVGLLNQRMIGTRKLHRRHFFFAMAVDVLNERVEDLAFLVEEEVAAVGKGVVVVMKATTAAQSSAALTGGARGTRPGILQSCF